MKVTALEKFRARLAADESVYGLWVTLESASITEMAVALGLDWVVVPWIETAQQMLAAKDAIRAAGKHCGVITLNDENMAERRDQGFRMLGLGIDSGLLLRSLRGALAPLGRDRRIRASLTLENE